jgi:urea transporter
MQTYKFVTIARSETNTHKGVGVVVTVSVQAGTDEHLSLCGTLTMTEPEWDALAQVLKTGLGGAVDFDDRAKQENL